MKITKTAVVSVVGRPNVGKSTLTNKLVGQKVAIVSSKPQTTRTRITGLLNKNGTQYVFLDTPGLHKPRTQLGDYMCKVVTDTVSEVDAAMLVVEPIANIGPAEEKPDRADQGTSYARCPRHQQDRHGQEGGAAERHRDLRRSAHEFEAVVPISARTGEGLDDLLGELSKYAIEGPQLFPEDMVSDQPERQLVAGDHPREDAPSARPRGPARRSCRHRERWHEREDGLVEISAVIYCGKASHKGIIIGKQGAMLREIGKQARGDIERMLDAKVYLELWVKVKEGWRNNQYQMRNFGYESSNPWQR
ncbi:MAG: GTPase Era [Butyricicoccaceae bacterium]